MQHFKNSCLALLIMTLVTGVIYPLGVTILASAIFPHQANGSLVIQGDQVVGSELIGQQFSDPKFFWGRLSATAPYPYNAAASSGSNLGPTNPALREAALQRVKQLASFGELTTEIPIDLITASASGLDPHISPQAAEFQIPRVAKARGLSDDSVRALVREHTEPRDLGILGEPRVHVLKLNLALMAAESSL